MNTHYATQIKYCVHISYVQQEDPKNLAETATKLRLVYKRKAPTFS